MKKTKLNALVGGVILVMGTGFSNIALSEGHKEHKYKPSSKELTIEVMGLDTSTSLGTVKFSDTPYGLEISPSLNGLTAGMHGFHIHENGDCGSVEKNGDTVLGGAAGSHYDPRNTGQHGFPWAENSHLGDLPALYVNDSGEANKPVLAPRLSVAKIKNRALMVHAHGDNYSDEPKPLGGGGSRVACGVIEHSNKH